MDVRHPSSGLVPAAGPTMRDRARDRLSVHHDGPAAPGSEPARAARGLTQLVLDCLTLFGEVEPTTATSCSDLERWLDRVLLGVRDVDTVPVVVVPAATWVVHLTGRPTRPTPARGVVVVFGEGTGPVEGWPTVHHVTAVRPGEVPGALGEALAGQSCTVVHVLPG